VVTVGPGRAAEFAALARAHGVPAAAIGAVTGESLRVTGQFDIPLDELASVWQGTLPRLFG
jgi:phosphoribosylformylglycinamidine synthase